MKNDQGEMLAIQVAATVAERFGAHGYPMVLGRSKNLSLLFAEAGIVARVTRRERINSLQKEADVALHLARCSAPSARLIDQGSTTPVISGDYAILFWHHVAGYRIDEGDTELLAIAVRSLDDLHKALASYPGRLDDAWTMIGKCGDALRDPDALAQLSDSDRSMLLRALDRSRRRAETIGGQDIVLHGDAHLGNVIFTDVGPVWLDFEDVCRGPREWDYCRLTEVPPPGVANTDMFENFLVLRSICVAVWCWKLAHDPAKLAAAQEHTMLVRRWMGV